MIGKLFLDDALLQLKKHKHFTETAIAQISDDQLFESPDSENNSIAIIMKHMAGNMVSRWTDFLTTDGEKNRKRDLEFEREDADTKEHLLKNWNAAWEGTLNTISSLSEDDLSKTIYIREEPHLVLEAINRQLTHYAYHVGQIVFLARHFAGNNWKSLSIPKGMSKEYEVAKNVIKYKPGN
jgi:uncharacterized damage-inducible protein DinB